MRMAKYSPAGWPRVIPRISADDPKAVVSFIRHVFGAIGDHHPGRPSELRLGDSIILVGAATEREAMSAFLYVYVEDADTVYRLALEQGARSLEEPRDTPYGDRRAMVRDLWGNIWQIATRRAEV